MNPETEKLISSVNAKLDLLLLDKETLKKVIFGHDGISGIVSDVKDIKEKLLGRENYKEEGLISKVEKMDEFYKKMQNLGTFTLVVMGFSAAVGGFITWVVHKWDKIVSLFS